MTDLAVIDEAGPIDTLVLFSVEPEATITDVTHCFVRARLAALDVAGLVNHAAPSRRLRVQDISAEAIITDGRLGFAYLAVSEVALG